MADFVIGNNFLLLIVDHPVLFLQPADDPVYRLVKITKYPK